MPALRSGFVGASLPSAGPASVPGPANGAALPGGEAARLAEFCAADPSACPYVPASSAIPQPGPAPASVTAADDPLLPDGRTCASLSGSASFSYSASFTGTSGSATLSASVSVSAGVGFCWDYTDFLGFPVNSHWLDFNEYYTESLSATLTAGPSGFVESDFNSDPAQIAGGTIAEWSFFGLVTVSIDLHLSAEYNLTLGASSSITLTQGSDGSANQNYSWDSPGWTDTDVPTACLSPTESLSNGCIAITTSNPFSGSAVLRLGPELSATLALLGSGTSSLASITAWGFLYVELSLYYGVGNVPLPSDQDLSGGQCGSDYAVQGMQASWGVPSSSLPWLVVCWALGVQWGATYSALGGVFGGGIYTSPSYTLLAGPLATTVDICDLNVHICTPSLTFSNPVSPDPSFSMSSGETNELEVITPLYSTADSSWIGGSWTPPSCGTLSAVPSSPYEAGVLMDYQAPTLGGPLGTATCRLSYTTVLLSGLSIPAVQVNGVTFDVRILGTGFSVSYTGHFSFCYFHPDYLPCRLAAVPAKSVGLLLTGPNGQKYSASGKGGSLTIANLTNGTYTYVLSPPPGMTGKNGTRGVVRIVGGDAYLHIDLVPLTLTFSETGLPAGTPWSVAVDGESQSSGTPNVTFLGANGTLGYVVGNVPGYYVTPTNVSTVVVGSADVVVPITFTTRAIQPNPPPPTSPLTFAPTGLAGQGWTVFLAPGVSLTGPAPALDVPNGAYNYTVYGPAGYRPALHSGEVTVNGPTVVPVAFVPVLFPVIVSEVGLPNGTSWSPTVGPATATTTSTSVSFVLPNGTYPFTVKPVPGYFETTSGNVNLNGTGGVSAVVYFSPIEYPFAVYEFGLPIGTTFNATVLGHTLSTTVDGPGAFAFAMEPNATGTVNPGPVGGWKASVPAHGKFTVAGQPETVRVKYKPGPKPYYAVTFTEKGLPKNATYWNVTVGNESVASLSHKLVLSLPDGTYPYEVSPSGGLVATPASGMLTVSGHGVTVHVKFAPVTYAVTFTETGLAGGHWSVKVDGKTYKAAAGSPITVQLPNGTYSYQIKAVRGYSASGSPSPVAVSGGPASVAVTFVRSG